MTRVHAVAVLAVLWTTWCFLHSLLISQGFTARMERLLGGKYGYYRLAYNLFSLISLVPVIYFQVGLAENVIFAWPRPWYILKYCMYGVALVFFYGGFRVYDLDYMLGIKQIRAMGQGDEIEAREFGTKGVLGYVRHPWYSGAIFLVWAFGDITDVTLAVKTVLTAYLIIGTLLEEKKLVREIGEPYRAYRKKVAMFIPWKKG